MKRLFLASALTLLLFGSAYSNPFLQLMSGTVAVEEDGCTGDCITNLQSETGDHEATGAFGRYSSSRHRAGQFQATKTTDVCKIDAYISKSGTPTAQVRIGIYTDDLGEPGELIGSISEWIDSSNIGVSVDGTITRNICASVVADSYYWIVYEVDGFDSGNFYRASQTSLASGGVTKVMYSEDLLSWGLSTDSETIRYVLYE